MKKDPFFYFILDPQTYKLLCRDKKKYIYNCYKVVIIDIYNCVLKYI